MNPKNLYVIDGKAVLVTGCSSGIGRAISVFLAQKGYTVFATVRREGSVEELKKLEMPNLIPTYPLDLSRKEHYPVLQDFVMNELNNRHIPGLYAIINNAGGGSIAPIELLDLERFHIELQTRILGPVGLLQSFLPLIRQVRGRVLWIATPALLPIPFLTDIHACDFAVNYISRTLRIELSSWNIPSILIRCGGILTSAPEKTDLELKESFKKWPEKKLRLYRDVLKKEQQELADFDRKRTDPLEVAKIVFKALIDKKPKRRYKVGYMSGMAAFFEMFPQGIVDYIMEKRQSKGARISA
jgi:NAD(P)-dependent dehydrogenase (short-subunit alcohol dehydrogenase family)